MLSSWLNSTGSGGSSTIWGVDLFFSVSNWSTTAKIKLINVLNLSADIFKRSVGNVLSSLSEG